MPPCVHERVRHRQAHVVGRGEGPLALRVQEARRGLDLAGKGDRALREGLHVRLGDVVGTELPRVGPQRVEREVRSLEPHHVVVLGRHAFYQGLELGEVGRVESLVGPLVDERDDGGVEVSDIRIGLREGLVLEVRIRRGNVHPLLRGANPRRAAFLLFRTVERGSLRRVDVVAVPVELPDLEG